MLPEASKVTVTEIFYLRSKVRECNYKIGYNIATGGKKDEDYLNLESSTESAIASGISADSER